jgi:putative pyrroloquinoline-quinone binding quinoprotein
LSTHTEYIFYPLTLSAFEYVIPLVRYILAASARVGGCRVDPLVARFGTRPENPQADSRVGSPGCGGCDWWAGEATTQTGRTDCRGGSSLATDNTPLANSWPAEGPPVLWSLPVTQGYAGAAVSQGRVLLVDYDEEAGADLIRCLSLDDGREIWRNSYRVELVPNHGLTRTIPQIVDNWVITLGPRSHLACWDLETGKSHWLIDLALEYGATVPQWYTGQCPLVDQGRLIVTTFGESMLVAFDYKTGKEIWKSGNPRNWTSTHASVMPMDLGEKRTYVCCGSGGIAALNADDGTLVWDSTIWPLRFATSPSPVVLPQNRIFLCSGYRSDVGAMILQLEPSADTVKVSVQHQIAPKIFNSEQQTPIFHDGHLFGVRKNGGGRMVCLDLDGKPVWDSGGDRFGHGPYLLAGELLLAMDNSGVLTLARATTSGYERLARHEVFADGHDAWGPMALVEGRLILRDMTRMTCLDLRAQ